MADIKNYFPISTKRNLSDQSENGEEPKKLKEGSVGNKPESNEEVFSKTSNIVDPQIVTENRSVGDTLKDLQAKMIEMFMLAQKTNESQIKGEQQLIDLTKSVKFISEQFDAYEKDRKEKEEIIKNLEGKVNNLTETVAKLIKKADDQEQYSRRNCLLVHGLPENSRENTDDLVISMFKNEMDMEVFSDDIDRSHRIGKKKDDPNKVRPVIVKFTRYNVRSNVYRNKKRLKGKKLSITESLTKLRLEKLKEAKDEFGFKNVWSTDGRILFKDEGSDQTRVYYE